MSKSTTMKSGASMRKAAGHSTPKSRFGRNTKYVLGAGALILAVGGLVIAAKPDPVNRTPTAVEMVRASAANKSSSQLTTTQTKFSFGPISMASGKVKHRYPITNAGTEPVVISKLYTSCMCTTAALVKDGKAGEAFGMPGHTPIPTINVPIKPGEQAFVEVVFDPAAHGPAGVGPIERVVTLENNGGQPLELEFAALVSP
ncbi:MAG: DUF1573 domain-containing protein [Burkholderiales bacterium]|nr:DUF1573 domain-containing protein [Burkholderiales bacterium]